MAKSGKPPAEIDPPPAEAAALCDHELQARRENQRLARRKRDIESSRPPGDEAAD